MRHFKAITVPRADAFDDIEEMLTGLAESLQGLFDRTDSAVKEAWGKE